MKKVLDARGAPGAGSLLKVVLAVVLLALLSAPRAPADGLAPSHGPDPMPLVAQLDVSPAAHACREEGERAFRVLYVVPPSTLDLHEAREPAIRAGIALAVGVVLESSLPHGVDARLRFVCDGEGEVLIERARTTTPPLAASFSTIARELREQGYGAADEKYWVLYEGALYGCGGCAGQGSIWSDDRPGPENLNNGGAMYAMTYLASFGPRAAVAPLANVMLHEASHTMGAVQHSAPHATGGFHCNDGADVMCYPDAAPGSAYTSRACPRLLATHVGPEMPYDCGADDYFHPSPAPGSYLAEHWNLGSRANLFLEWRRV